MSGERRERPFDPATDVAAAERIWREVGWVQEDEHAVGLRSVLADGRWLVTDLNGAAECLVGTCRGTVRHDRTVLPFSCVTAVTTSRVARKQGLAGRLTSRAIAADVEEGAAVTGLGMFEQGFYDRLGFGVGAEETFVEFDPSRLLLPSRPPRRPPRRLAATDFEAVHANRHLRRQGHGAVCLEPAVHTKCEMEWDGKKGFGLGFFDGPRGALSHHAWFQDLGGEHGPLRLSWMAAQNDVQLLELLGLIKDLGDQVHLVKMSDPQGIQMQKLIDRPSSALRITRGARNFEQRFWHWAWWQMRINDVATCVEALRTPIDVHFNLRLHDPIERYLPDDSRWRGAGGDWTVTLGASSGAAPGHAAGLPLLETSVNTFTRLWIGVRPASGLVVTDGLQAPPELLETLDDAIRLPLPRPGWEF